MIDSYRIVELYPFKVFECKVKFNDGVVYASVRFDEDGESFVPYETGESIYVFTVPCDEVDTSEETDYDNVAKYLDDEEALYNQIVKYYSHVGHIEEDTWFLAE